MKNKIVILAGPSGGGKTFIENKLCTEYSDFNKLKQVTTRGLREGESQGSPYMFISSEEYRHVESKLIGKANVKGELYGTLFEPKNNYYNTIILNEQGIEDFTREFKDNKNIEFMTIMIDSDSPAIREGRDIDYVNKERKQIMKLADVIVKNNPPEFSNIKDIRKSIDDYFNNK